MKLKKNYGKKKLKIEAKNLEKKWRQNAKKTRSKVIR